MNLATRHKNSRQTGVRLFEADNRLICEHFARVSDCKYTAFYLNYMKLNRIN